LIVVRPLAAAIGDRIEQVGLPLHPDKTRAVYCWSATAVATAAPQMDGGPHSVGRRVVSFVKDNVKFAARIAAPNWRPLHGT
jgi:hypothetical protein